MKQNKCNSSSYSRFFRVVLSLKESYERTFEPENRIVYTYMHMYVCTYLLRGKAVKRNTCGHVYMCWSACARSTLQWLHNEKGCGLIKEARGGENERRLDVIAEAQLDLQGLFLNKGLEHKTKRISLRRNLRKKKKDKRERRSHSWINSTWNNEEFVHMFQLYCALPQYGYRCLKRNIKLYVDLERNVSYGDVYYIIFNLTLQIKFFDKCLL